MKKSIIAIILVAVSVLFVFAPQNKAAYAADMSEAPVIINSATTSGKEVTVDAVLRKNSGIEGLTVTISYDASVMTLTNVERGEALSSLEYLTTNVNTEKGYAYMPFKVNWSGEQNDMSTGNLIRMSFLIKDTAADGDYTITLRTDGNKPATYLEDGKIKSKSVLIGATVIRIKGAIPEALTTEEIEGGELKSPNVALIVSLSVAGGVVVAGAVVVLILIMKGKKGKKTWKKVE